MSPSLLLPNPSLVAILLVVKTKSEPRLVFHYPPKPGEDNTRFRHLVKELAEDDSSTTSSEDGESSGEDAAPVEDHHAPTQADGNTSDMYEIGLVSPEKRKGYTEEDEKAQWNDIFGYPTGLLAKLLCPHEVSHKKRMEIGLEGRVFLGQPVFAGADGEWKKRKPRRSAREGVMEGGALDSTVESLQHTVSIENSNSVTDVKVQEPNVETAADSWEKFVDERNKSEQRRDADGSKMTITIDENKPKSPLNMFHISFVLDPPPLEYHLRVKEMYDNVIRKFTKALRWEQARTHYMAKEASVITSIVKRVTRNSGRNPNLSSLYHDIIAESTLARAIAILYNCITTSRIAHLNLTSSTSLSLQIPVPTSISALPSTLSPQLPGLWLTTATSMPLENEVQTPTSHPGAHFGLLLLVDLPTILADVNAASSPIAAPLSHYLRVSKPTKSFHQISQASKIPLQDVQFLASHLIYWRRARAIPPLNQRDIYIMSPNADLRNLAAATSSFSKSFPSSPTLPKVLSMLSTTPRPYATLIPSKDYKETYLEILAWLMRNGWVTQLRNFAWVRVPPLIIKKFNIDIANEAGNSRSSSATKYHTQAPERKSPEVPNLRVSSPASSTTTTIHIPTKGLDRPVIIFDPRSASIEQSRYLSTISQHVQAVHGEESRQAWEICLKYFDGKHAIESIGIIEGWKKKRTFELVAAWEELGIVLRGRCW